jgi:hypothetical protein
MQAAVVEALIERAKFAPTVALALADAMDTAMNGAQLVTVPLLDARLEALKAELVRWVFLVMLGNVALTAGVTAVLNALQRS